MHDNQVKAIDRRIRLLSAFARFDFVVFVSFAVVSAKRRSRCHMRRLQYQSRFLWEISTPDPSLLVQPAAGQLTGGMFVLESLSVDGDFSNSG